MASKDRRIPIHLGAKRQTKVLWGTNKASDAEPSEPMSLSTLWRPLSLKRPADLLRCSPWVSLLSRPVLRGWYAPVIGAADF